MGIVIGIAALAVLFGAHKLMQRGLARSGRKTSAAGIVVGIVLIILGVMVAVGLVLKVDVFVWLK